MDEQFSTDTVTRDRNRGRRLKAALSDIATHRFDKQWLDFVAELRLITQQHVHSDAERTG